MATAAAGEAKIDIGRVIQRGFETIGRNALAFLVLAILFGALPRVAIPWLLAGNVVGDMPVPAIIRYGLPFLALLVAGNIFQATVTRAAILDLSGQEPEFTASLVEAVELVPAMIGISILSSILIVIGMVLLVVPGVFLYVVLIVAIPALVEERGGVIASMTRSRDLTDGSRGRIFLLLLIFLLAYLGIAAGVAILPQVAGDPFGWPKLIADAAVGAVTGLLGAAMLSSLYVELRTVKEGATADSLAAVFA